MRSTPTGPGYSAPSAEFPPLDLSSETTSEALKLFLLLTVKFIWCGGARTKWTVMAKRSADVSPSKLTSWLLMPAADKSYEPPPRYQGHTHHRFTGLSAQVMHGLHSQSVSHSIYNKLRRQKPTHHRWDGRILGPPARSWILMWCERIINLMFSLVMEILIRCQGRQNEWKIINYAWSHSLVFAAYVDFS